jgi:hypothetical protein
MRRRPQTASAAHALNAVQIAAVRSESGIPALSTQVIAFTHHVCRIYATFDETHSCLFGSEGRSWCALLLLQKVFFYYYKCCCLDITNVNNNTDILKTYITSNEHDTLISNF